MKETADATLVGFGFLLRSKGSRVDRKRVKEQEGGKKA